MQVFGLPGHLIRSARAASRLLAAKTPKIEAERRRDAAASAGGARQGPDRRRGGGAPRSTLGRWRARLVFPSKYSPDLNPIEEDFAELRTLLRKATARTTDDVAKILSEPSTEECAQDLRNAGDGQT